MDLFVTLTYDPSTGCTVVDDRADARGPVAIPEPDGILGAWRAGWLYASSGRTVRVELLRDDSSAR